MASKKSAPTDAELSAMFEGIGGDEDDASATSQAQASKPLPSETTETDENDPFAELKNLASASRTSTSSRPETPHLTATTSTSRTHTPAGHRSNVYTPTTGSGRSSEERAAAEADPQRLSVETEKGSRAQQASVQQSEEAEKAAGGSWWGGFTAIASAAVKQGQAALQEIQKNEEAQRWAEQVRGNYGALRGIGRSRDIFSVLMRRLLSPCRLKSSADFHKYHSDSRPTHLATRTPPNPHHTRPHQLPLPRSPHLSDLLPRHVASRRRRPDGNPAGLRIKPETA